MKTMSAREAVLIEKHGRGVVMVIAVEEYERLTVDFATKAKTAERETGAARK
jgi:PHD/YefM family antitoxin component YafN of YafNO toxin-antitoxin module